MLCPRCGAQLPASMRFCGYCGEELLRSCSACGVAMPADFKFCGNCGVNLAAAAASPASSAPRPSVPVSTTPASASPAAPPPAPEAQPAASLDGERRLVTVLFADVSGSTALGSRLDAEEVAAIMNECFAVLGAAIERQGGAIDKYIGDAVMALFGAPTAHEDDPERAVRAALAMQQEMREFSHRIERRTGFPLQIRIGINTGPVVAAEIGNIGSASYTVMGDTVNVASRLEHAAGVGKVLVSASTYLAARAAFDFCAQPPLQVKGKDEPLTVYELVEARRVRGRTRGIEGLQSSLVGRQSEIAALHEAFNEAQAGQRRLVLVEGEAGIGKSRLCEDFRKELELDGLLASATFARAACLPQGQAHTFGLALEILRQVLGIEEGATAVALRERVAALADEEGTDLICHLLAPTAEEERSAQYDGEDQQRMALLAIVRAFARRAEQGPLVLLADDLHWIDASSLAFLDFLVEHTGDLPILYCFLFRPDFHVPATWGEGRATKLSLRPLSEGDVLLLMRSLLSDAELSSPVRQVITGRAGGNPLYVEEILRSLIDRGVLRRDGERWQVGTEVAALDVPDTVQRLVMARFDRLTEQPRLVLQHAAVIGRTFPVPLLQAVLGDGAVVELLDQIEQLGLILPAEAAPEEYVFRHTLVQETIYNSLLLRKRKELHGRLGACIESLYANRLGQYVGQLAHHYGVAEVWPKALAYCQRAASHARSLFANREAIDYYDRALAILDRCAEAPAGAEQPPAAAEQPAEPAPPRWALLCERGDVKAVVGEYEAAAADYEGALPLIADQPTRTDICWRLAEVQERLGRYEAALAWLEKGTAELGTTAAQAPLRAKLLASLGWVYIRQGKSEAACQVSEESCALLADRPDCPEMVKVCRTLGFVHYRTSDWNRALDYWQQGLSLAERLHVLHDVGTLRNNVALACYQAGQHERAVAELQTNISHMERIGDVRAAYGSYLNLAVIHQKAGRFDTATFYYAKVLEIQRQMGDVRQQITTHINLGELQRETGRLAEAIANLDLARELAETAGAKEALAQIYRQLAETRLELGQRDEALTLGREALAVAEEVGDRLEQSLAYRALGRISAGEDDGRAEGYLRQSVDVLTALASERELALTLLALGTFLQRGGRSAEAAENLRRAAALLARVGSPPDQEKARVALESVGLAADEPASVLLAPPSQ